MELDNAKSCYTMSGNLEEQIETIKDDITDFLRKLEAKRKENEATIDSFFTRIVDQVKSRQEEVHRKMK